MKLLKTTLLLAAVFAVASCKNPPQEESQATTPEANTEPAAEKTFESTLVEKKAEPTCPHAQAANHDCPHAKALDPTCPHAEKGSPDCGCAKAEGEKTSECPHHKKEEGKECGCTKTGGEKTHECPYHKEGAGAAAGDMKGKITCPVSGEVIEDISKANKSEYKGKSYYFCCEGCKAKFDAAPEKFAGK